MNKFSSILLLLLITQIVISIDADVNNDATAIACRVANCLECDDNIAICERCKPQYYLLRYKNLCQLCGSSLAYCDSCVQDFDYDSIECTSCISGYYLLNHECFACGLSNCISCYLDTWIKCSQCAPNFHLINGTCLNCQPAIPFCQSCYQPTNSSSATCL
jgi:hypothetical protein